MIELLEKAEIFAGLKKDELKQLAKYCGSVSYNAGDCIFKEGDPGRDFYIVISGSVDIVRAQSDGSEREIARFVQGESFGEMDLIENSPRIASARAVSDCELLQFPGRGFTFDYVLKENPHISAKMLREIIAIIAGRIRATNWLISEKAPWVRDLRRQLMTDKLTGLFNRTYLDEDFASRINEYGDSSAVIMVKPDNFKYINDTFGHETGDAVLVRMADRFKRLMKEGYEAVRYRGNELTAVIPGADKTAADNAARELKSGMDSMDIGDLTGGKKTSLTFSIGIAVYPDDSRDGVEVISSGYTRLYKSIEEGGDRITGGEG